MPERHFTQAKILEALQALGDELTRQRVRGQIFVVGGAAMALAYSTRRVTKDTQATPSARRVPRVRSMQRLLTLEWLLAELAELYEPEEAHLWLFAPHRLLGGERPADRIQQGKPDDVLALIAQLRDGAYV